MADTSPLVDTYGLFIDGSWVEPDAGRYDVINPATERSITSAPDASVGQVQDAISAARSAFDSGSWSGLDPAERARCIQQLSDAMLARADEINGLAQAEWGCSANERIIHVEGPAFMVGHAAELAVEPAEAPLDAWGAAGRTLLRYEPLGVVSILTPWNFPHTLNAMKVGVALAAGNTVVLKPSPLTPLAALALARLIDEETDIPAGVVNVVTPTSVEASRTLTVDPRVDMVSFTGSSAVGRNVMAGAAETMKRILLECGGKSASVLLDDAEVDEELLQRLLFEGCTLHAGQACILNSRLLVRERRRGRRSRRPGGDDGPTHQSRTPGTGRGVGSAGRTRRCHRGDGRRSAEASERGLLFRADNPQRCHRRFVHRSGRGVRTGADGAPL